MQNVETRPSGATEESLVSPFEEIKTMNYTSAVNILIQASNAAQRAGALTVRDSVLLASAAEFLTAPKKEEVEEA